MSCAAQRAILSVIAAAVAACTWAQPVEDVIVEVFHEEPSMVPGKPPLTTYRVFIDLAPGHELQMVYGEGHQHQFFFFTTTYFHNDEEHGVEYADRLDPALLDERTTALDSWLTIGAASKGHMGVPRNLDPDGSIHACPVPVLEGAPRNADPLCPEDGLVAVTEVKEVVNFQNYTSYLGKVRGQLVESTDAAWGVLGGMKGPTPENIVLVAQITTDGEFSFKLNLQVGTPDHRAVKVVAENPQEGEVLFEGLSYGRDYHEGH